MQSEKKVSVFRSQKIRKHPPCLNLSPYPYTDVETTSTIHEAAIYPPHPTGIDITFYNFTTSTSLVPRDSIAHITTTSTSPKS